MRQHHAAVAAAIALVFEHAARSQDPPIQFISLDAARPIIQLSSSLPATLNTRGLDSIQWLEWLKTADAQVRRRLEAGEEDTLTNLLRFGTTFTNEYRIDDEYFAHYGESTLVNSFAEHRAADLVRALTTTSVNEGFREMRALLERKGFALDTPSGRSRAKRYLLANLARMHGEFLEARQHAKTNRWQMFAARGISLDTNLWPDFDVDFELRQMAAHGTLKSGSIRRVAIIGPGLDFVNKQEGVDSYPPQTTQPFALLDSLLHLKLADAHDIQIYTFDISSLVNAHLAAARQQAAAGHPYTLQLPWFAGGRWSDEFRGNFVEYWQTLGSQIGEPTPPIPPPQAAAGIQTRALRVHPSLVARIRPVNVNIVFQFLPLPPEDQFDLVVGTNIFLYYEEFQQLLARRNISAMLRPGGYLLSNDKLAEAVPSHLDLVATTAIAMTGAPVITDYIFCYRRNP